jgi:CheY-like chemotaxis protein
MGIHSFKATTGREASALIQSQPVHVAIVDLSLPLDADPASQEAGPRVLELLSRLSQPPPTLVIKRSRTHRDDSRELAAALKAGAFAVLDRPRGQHDLELLLEMLRRVLCRHYQGRWPGSA